MCDKSLLSTPWLMNRIYYIPQFAFILVMFAAEWLQRKQEYALAIDNVQSKTLRYCIYGVLIILLLWVGGQAETFIYFQF